LKLQIRLRLMTALLLGVVLLILTTLVFQSSKEEAYEKIKVDKISQPLVNPLMGWAPWATIERSAQPHSLVYADLTWRDFEPSEGRYDFSSFEAEQQLPRWREEGKRVVFRFVMDVPRKTSHLDIPDWLFEKINGSGEFYDTDYGQGFSPDYSNPYLIERHRLAIQALGEHYGRDGFFAFIELGSLGHWGEWHVHPDLSQIPDEKVRDQYVLHYINAFQDVHLLMRRPFSIAQEKGLGLYNDMTGNLEQTNTWLGWIANGGVYLPGEDNSLLAMPDGWVYAPIGGEQDPTKSDELIYGTDFAVTLDLLRKSHTSFIGPGGPYDVGLDSPLQDRLDDVLSTIGYRLFISTVEMPAKVKISSTIKIKVELSNDGIAPFYYHWPIKMYLIDESGGLLTSYLVDADIRKILPGELSSLEIMLPVGDLPNGKYAIGLAIIDPMTGQPGIRLANQNSRNDLIQEAGSFEVDWLFKFLH